MTCTGEDKSRCLQSMSVADIANAKNIQPSTVLSYLAEAIAAGHAYAWERFGVADSTLHSLGEAAVAFAAEELAAASDSDVVYAAAATSARASNEGSSPALPEAVAIPDGAAALCSCAEAPAGPADAAENADVRCGGSESGTSLLATTNTLPAGPVQGAQAEAAKQGCIEMQPPDQLYGGSEKLTDGAAAVPLGCVPLTASTAACVEDLILQRVSLRPLRERLPFDIDFGVLRLALAHLARLSRRCEEHSTVMLRESAKLSAFPLSGCSGNAMTASVV